MSMLYIFGTILAFWMQVGQFSCPEELVPIFYEGTISKVHGSWAIKINMTTNILADLILLSVLPIGTVPDNFDFANGGQFLPGVMPIMVPHPDYPPTPMFLNISSYCTIPQCLVIEVGENQPECPPDSISLILRVLLCNGSNDCSQPTNVSTISDTCTCTSILDNSVSMCSLPTAVPTPFPTVPAPTPPPTLAPTAPPTVAPTPLPTSAPTPTPSTIAPTFTADVCTYSNGGCDYHAMCYVHTGTRMCGACPNGTVGSGYTECISLCGNGQCEAEAAEDCMTCHQDCACGVCGDGHCDIDETCKSCFADCGSSCEKENCNPECKHGYCSEDGVCVCSGSWTGPSCDANSDNFTVTANSTKLAVTIHPSSATTNFSIGLQQISEHMSDNTLVYGYLISDLSFYYNADERGFNYSTVLDNGAQFSMQVEYRVPTASSKANTIKVGVLISAWPFQAISNELHITFQSPISETGDKPCLKNAKDQASSLKWQYVKIHDVTLYAQFETTAILDNRTQSIEYRFNDTDNTVSAVLHHFWEFARMDPEYGVLLNDNTLCGSLNVKKMVIAIVVPVVVVAAIFTVVFIVHIRPRCMRWLGVKKANNAITVGSVEMDVRPTKRRI